MKKNTITKGELEAEVDVEVSMKEEESKDKDKKDGEEQNLMLNIKDLHFDNCLPLDEENGKLLVLSKKFFTLKKNKHHEDKASIP